MEGGVVAELGKKRWCTEKLSSKLDTADIFTNATLPPDEVRRKGGAFGVSVDHSHRSHRWGLGFVRIGHQLEFGQATNPKREAILCN